MIIKFNKGLFKAHETFDKHKFDNLISHSYGMKQCSCGSIIIIAHYEHYKISMDNIINIFKNLGIKIERIEPLYLSKYSHKLIQVVPE